MCTFNRVTREFPSLWKFQSSIWCNGNDLVAGFILALEFIVSPQCAKNTMKNLEALSFVEFRQVEAVLDEMFLQPTLLMLGNSSGGNWYQKKKWMDREHQGLL